MRKSNTHQKAATRWFAAWRRPALRSAQDDPADLGTAFGLDLSLHQQPADLTDAELRALRAATAPPPAARPRNMGHAAGHDSSNGNDADAVPQRGWVQRLGISRKQVV